MKNNRKMSFGSMMVVAMVTVAALASLAPVASAHKCAADSGCDPNGCVEGEYHSHTRYRWPQPDEYCETKEKAPEPQPGRCDDKPLIEKLICIIIGTAETGSTPEADATRLA